MIKNTLPDKSVNPESLKINRNSSRTLQPICPLVDKDLLKAFYRLFYLQFCEISDQWKNTVQERFHRQFKRYFYMKVIVTTIPTGLVTNSLLSSFCPFLQIKNKNQIFSRLVVWKLEIFLVFVYSESHSASKPCRIQ